NPTGAVYSEQALAELGRRLERFGQPVSVICDEPYKALTFDGVKTPEVPRFIERTVIANSWSKALAIPGERIGYLAISPRIPDARQLFDAFEFTLRVLGFVNAPALWQRVVAAVGDKTIDIRPYQEKRDLLCDALERFGYQLVRPQGAFYVFPRTPIEDDVAYVRLLQEAGVLTVPGVAFGRSEHIRISLTVARETIEKALPSFERVFASAATS
ncbi:MAG: aminotransferase class I/II-fold pyridoxal phosphate-dependent enzyme, partial [Acidobacteriota bacterium]